MGMKNVAGRTDTNDITPFVGMIHETECLLCSKQLAIFRAQTITQYFRYFLKVFVPTLDIDERMSS